MNDVHSKYGEARPAPQYGEFATPDEQARAAGLPLPSQLPAPSPLPTQPQLPAQPLAPPAPGTAQSAPPPPNVDGAALRSAPTGSSNQVAAGRTPHRWDLILSLALLAFGASSIVNGFSSTNDLNSTMVQVYKTMGLGTYTASDLAQTLATVIKISTGVLYIITFAVTAQLLRRRRIAFYVPIIGAALSVVLAFVCMSLLLASDPAAITHLNNR